MSLWPPSPLFVLFFVQPLVKKFYVKLRNRVHSALAMYALEEYMAMDEPVPPGIGMHDPIFQFGRRGREARIRLEEIQNPPAGGGERERQAAPIRLSLIRMLNHGTRLLNALAKPFIASYMGSLLLNLSNHSDYLHAFLAPAPQTLLKQVTQTGVLATISTILGNARGLDSHDPVWWRNALGYGGFVVVSCFYLIHCYIHSPHRRQETLLLVFRCISIIDAPSMSPLRTDRSEQ